MKPARVALPPRDGSAVCGRRCCASREQSVSGLASRRSCGERACVAEGPSGRTRTSNPQTHTNTMDASAALLWLVVLVAGVHAFVNRQEILEDQRQLPQVDDLEEELQELKTNAEEAAQTNKSASQRDDINSEVNHKNWSGNSSLVDSSEVYSPIVNITEEVQRFPSSDSKKNDQLFLQDAFGKMKEQSQLSDEENLSNAQEENDTVIREFHKVAEDLLELLVHIAERPAQWDKLIRKLNDATGSGDQSESLTSSKRQKIKEMFGNNVSKFDNLDLKNKYGTEYPIKEKQIYTLYNWKDRNLPMKQLLKARMLHPPDQIGKYKKYRNTNENEVTNAGDRGPPILFSNYKAEQEQGGNIDYKLMQPEKESEYNKFPFKEKQISQYMKMHNAQSQNQSNETRLQNEISRSPIGIQEGRQISSSSTSNNSTAPPENRNSLPDGHRWPHFTYHRVTSRPAHRASHRDAYIAVSVARGTQPAVGQRGPTTPSATSTTAAPPVETIGRVLRMRDPLEEELVDMAAAKMPPAPQRTPMPLPVSFVAWSHAQHLNKLQEQIKSLAAMEDKLNYKSADRERLRQILRDGKSDPVQPIRAM